MKNLNGNGKLIAGLLLGAAAGATLGILFAPSEGEKTRKKINKDVDKFSNEVANKFNHEVETFKNKANNLLASTRPKPFAKQAEEGVEKAEKIANDLKSEAKDKANSK